MSRCGLGRPSCTHCPSEPGRDCQPPALPAGIPVPRRLDVRGGLILSGPGYCTDMTLVLVILAMILLGLAAFRVGPLPRVDFGWLGMTLLVLAVWVLPAIHG